VKLETKEHRVKAKMEASCDCCSELKGELIELKQTLDSVVAEIWKNEGEACRDDSWADSCAEAWAEANGYVSECVCQLALVCRSGAAIGGAVFTNCSPSSFSCSSAYI
jgi:hypothetical protein